MKTLRTHVGRFFKTHALLKGLLLLALLLDTASTIYFMKRECIQCERHLLVRQAALFCGPVLGAFLSIFFFKAITSFLLEIYYLKKYAIYLYSAMICTSTAAGIFNFANTL